MEENISILKFINEKILECGRKYAQYFEEDNLKFTEALLILGGSRKFMNWVYRILVGRKLLTKLEDLPQEDKESLWSFVKEICVGQHRTKEKMHQMVIVFYTIEYLLNNPEDKSCSNSNA